jgi:hypothetical protein
MLFFYCVLFLNNRKTKNNDLFKENVGAGKIPLSLSGIFFLK